jgi:hypothetical protein
MQPALACLLPAEFLLAMLGSAPMVGLGTATLGTFSVCPAALGLCINVLSLKKHNTIRDRRLSRIDQATVWSAWRTGSSGRIGLFMGRMQVD